MRLPTPVLGVLCMAALVAVPSFIAFTITKANAEDSIDEVSRRLADARMQTIASEIRFKLQTEPVDAILAGKSDLEHGLMDYHIPKYIHEWGRRGIQWINHSGFFSLYMVLGGTKELGDIHGHGLIVDGGGETMVVSIPPKIAIYRPMDMVEGTWPNETNIFAPIDLPNRPYVSMFAIGPDRIEFRKANKPRWTDIVVSVNPSMPDTGGLFVTLSVPVFKTSAAHVDDFTGVVAVSIYLSKFDLVQYLLSDTSSLLVVDQEHRLITSTDMKRMGKKMYFEDGVVATGAPQYVRYNLLNCPVPLYAALGPKLPNLETMTNDDKYFSKLDFDGDIYWVEIRPVVHYNQQWYLVMLVPEKEFFQKIYDSNAETLIYVIVLIIASVVVAAVCTLLFTMNLRSLAKAFDKIATMQLTHPDVLAVRRSHCLSELDSLSRGFWHAVEMVRQVQAFLPNVDSDDDNDGEDDSTEESTREADGGVSASSSRTAGGSSFSKSRCQLKGRNELTSALQLGLKSTRKASCAALSFSDFSSQCRSNMDEAVADHLVFFRQVSQVVKSHRGVIANLEGNRLIVTWNTTRSCPPTSSKQSAIDLAFVCNDMAPQLKFKIEIGLSCCSVFYGILGSATQRYSVIGSELVDSAATLALHAQDLDLPVPILATFAAVDTMKGFTYYHIDDYVVPGGRVLQTYWLEKKVEVEMQEWMYQLQQESAESKQFLTRFFTEKNGGNWEAALLHLKSFAAEHTSFPMVVKKHKTDLCALRFAAEMDA